MSLVGLGPQNVDNGGFNNSDNDPSDMLNEMTNNVLQVYEILHQTKWFASGKDNLGLRPLPISPICVIPSAEAAKMIVLEYYRELIMLYSKVDPVWHEGVSDEGYHYFQTSFPMGDIYDTTALREIVRVVERKMFYRNNKLQLI